MNWKDKAILVGLGLFVVGLLLFTCIGVPILAWYQAGLQAEVYRRQGVEMTPWEVFMGSKPAERTINVKERL